MFVLCRSVFLFVYCYVVLIWFFLLYIVDASEAEVKLFWD